MEIAVARNAGATARYQVATMGTRFSAEQCPKSNLRDPYVEDRLKEVAYPLYIPCTKALSWGFASKQAMRAVEPILRIR